MYYLYHSYTIKLLHKLNMGAAGKRVFSNANKRKREQGRLDEEEKGRRVVTIRLLLSKASG